MALYKELTDERGVTTRYHRISGFEIGKDAAIVNVTLRSYTDSEFRETEKNNNNNIKQIQDKWLKIDELSRINQDGIHTAELEKLYIELRELERLSKDQPLQLFLKEIREVLPFEDTDYSLSVLYRSLQESGILEGAEDV